MTALRVGVAGLGTVGMGVLDLLDRNAGLIAARAGRTFRVTAVSARDVSRDRGRDLSGLAWHENPVALARDANVDIVVEVIGGGGWCGPRHGRGGAYRQKTGGDRE